MFRKKGGLSGSVITQEKFDTIIGRQTEFRGDLRVSESLRIDGQLIGNVSGAEGHPVTVVVGSQGGVSGNITAQRVLVAGQVKGCIEATDEVELHAQALVEGDIVCESVSIAHGARVLGRLTATRDPAQREDATFAAQPTPIGHTKIERVA
jgi:cytoskeletal protein CcmA (bactofilin family)